MKKTLNSVVRAFVLPLAVVIIPLAVLNISSKINENKKDKILKCASPKNIEQNKREYDIALLAVFDSVKNANGYLNADLVKGSMFLNNRRFEKARSRRIKNWTAKDVVQQRYATEQLFAASYYVHEGYDADGNETGSRHYRTEYVDELTNRVKSHEK